MCPKMHIWGQKWPFLGLTLLIFWEETKKLVHKYQKITLENFAPLRKKKTLSSTLRAPLFFFLQNPTFFVLCTMLSVGNMASPKSARTGDLGESVMFLKIFTQSHCGTLSVINSPCLLQHARPSDKK